MKENRVGFASRLGMIAAAAGSAVGLGNIWRFPSETASSGGALFILIYLVCILFFGIPLMTAEFMIGRSTQANASRSFSILRPKSPWFLVGAMGILAAFLILGFYFVVCGWTLVYIWDSISGTLMASESMATNFTDLLANPMKQSISMVIFIALTAFFVMSGVKKGIEKSAKILMPILFLLLIVLAARSVTLEGAGEGLAFLFSPNFEEMRPDVFLSALGQSFFSLSLGMGIMLTYGSYFQRDSHLLNTTAKVAVLDSLVAILAGVVLFPAGFALSAGDAGVVEALTKGGPGLLFITLPGLFKALPLASVWATIFFVLLAVAALTSTISLVEVVVVYLHEELRLSRPVATILVSSVLVVLGVACAVSSDLFDYLDFATAKVMLPLGGLFISIFAGWVLKTKFVKSELTNNGSLTLSQALLDLYIIILRYVAPVGIAVIFIYELFLK